MENLKNNCLVQIAIKNKRDYITPEDVTAAFDDYLFLEEKVRLDLLEILSGEFNCEDPRLCAFVATEGRSLKG